MGLYARYYSFKGSFSGLDSRRINTHFADGVLVKQVKTTAATHEDSHEVEFVNDWVEDQSCRSSMLDIGWVILSIEGDWTRRPWVEFWGDRLYGVDVP